MHTDTPRLHLIFARASNGVIGRDGRLPWHLPEDLAHFKRTTLGCPVIMGRKTWDSLPPKFRPLPGRANIVITRQAGWQPQGAVRAGSVAEAVAACAGAADAWVIGGAEIYAQALPLADTAVVTEIDSPFAGDALAPTLGAEWTLQAEPWQTAANHLRYRFVTWRRHGVGAV